MEVPLRIAGLEGNSNSSANSHCIDEGQAQRRVSSHPGRLGASYCWSGHPAQFSAASMVAPDELSFLVVPAGGSVGLDMSPGRPWKCGFLHRSS